MNKRILHFLEQAGMLMQMPRTHLRNLGRETFDTVASHSFHVAIIAYTIARMEGATHQVAKDALIMGLLHDISEARTGDADFIAKNYVSHDEEKAVKDQFKGLSFGRDLEKMVEDYEERESLASKCAKDADYVQQAYIEWVLMWQGNKLAERWFETKFSHQLPYLRTNAAKEILLALKDSHPHEWWWTEFVDNNYNHEHLNSKK